LNAAVSAGMFFYDANDRLTTDLYDNDGNTVSSGGIQDVYDFENHLIQHGAVAIVYDGDGNRVSETVGGVTTNYLVDTPGAPSFAAPSQRVGYAANPGLHSYPCPAASSATTATSSALHHL